MVCTKCIRFDSQTFYQTYCVRISLGISTFFPLWPTEWFCLENCTSRNLIKTIVFWIHKNVHFFSECIDRNDGRTVVVLEVVVVVLLLCCIDCVEESHQIDCFHFISQWTIHAELHIIGLHQNERTKFHMIIGKLLYIANIRSESYHHHHWKNESIVNGNLIM